MTARLFTLRNRLRPMFCTAAAVAALLAGAALLIAPAASTAVGGGAWPPLHARCVGAMLVSLAAALASARRALDPAALRMPLIGLAVWSLSSAALAGASGTAWWMGGLAAIGSAALLFARIDSDPPAPAQHADKAWRAFALLAALVAALLFASPHNVAAYWPWRLAASFVTQYAALFLAWGPAAWLVSRERRRYVRVPVLWGLLTWAVGVLGVSLWHIAVFRWTQPQAWVWIAAFAAVGLLAAHRLWPAWPKRCRRALGPRPHDNGTDLPRQ